MLTTPEPTTSPSTATKGGRPKYQVLTEELRDLITQGKLLPGDKFPTFNEFAAKHRVTLTTIRRVYEQLEKEGLIERQQGRGTFVCEQKRAFTGNIGIIGTSYIRQRQVQYYDFIIRGVEQYLLEHGQHLLFLGESANLHHELTEKVDGFLMCDVEFQTEEIKELASRFPAVAMFLQCDNASSVVVDDYEGARTATRYLMEQGHRRIACLMQQQIFVARERYSGYRDALTEGGIGPEDSWARLTVPGAVSSTAPGYLQWGRVHMQRWLDEGWLDLGCTALLVQNDIAAIGVMKVLNEAGISVPAQVSVMGFDGTDLCDHSSPSLTSMEIPLTEVGYTAAKLLHEQIYQPPTTPSEMRNIVLPMTVRAGESVAAVDSSKN